MSLLTKIRMLGQIIHWKRHYADRDNHWKPAEARTNPKFKSGSEAAALIPDGAVCASGGMGGTMRPSTLYFAIRDQFESTGHPRDLTWIAPGGLGGRGKVPGSVEEVARKGLVARFISGHHETVRTALDAAEQGRMELAVLPQGTIVHLAEAQGRGEGSLLSEVGVGTFMDPRVGNGSQVVPGQGEQLVQAEGDKLRYRLPPIQVAVIVCTAADAEGNLYMKDAPLLAEHKENALAARANGGVVLATVARVLPKDPGAIFLRADQVDAIVVNPRNEMTLTVPQVKAWPELTPGWRGPLGPVLGRIQAFNAITKLDPVRGPVENALARQAAAVFARIGRPGVHAIIGYGLPQEVGRLMFQGGLSRDVNFLIETGVIGGTPAPGFFFGMSLGPERLITSGEMFHFCKEHLDITVLGMLQVDAAGNVNVSRRGPGPRGYVGPGGFIDLVTRTKNVIFIGQWMARAGMSVEGGRLSIAKPGIPKFVGKVDEVTFCAAEALKSGKCVYYCTNVGTFRLTERGLELFQVAPGVDIQRDILDAAPDARVVLPRDGNVEVLAPSILTGRDFRLQWADPTPLRTAAWKEPDGREHLGA